MKAQYKKVISDTKFQDLIRPENIIEKNNKIISDSIDQIIKENKFNDQTDHRNQIFHQLLELFKAGSIKLDFSVYKACDSQAPGGYGRYHMYSYKNENYEFSMWTFAFAPGNKTVIHNHRINCLTSILSEQSLTEKTYKIFSHKDNLVDRGPAKVERTQFTINEDNLDPENSFVHSIKNMSSATNTGISMHMYFKAVENPKTFSSLSQSFTKQIKSNTVKGIR